MGVERLPGNLLTFLSPYPHTPYHHLDFEVPPLWSHRYLPLHQEDMSLQPCLSHALQNKLPQKKGSSSLIPMLNQLELIIDVVPVFALYRGLHQTPRGHKRNHKRIRWGMNKQPQDWHITLAMVR